MSRKRIAIAGLLLATVLWDSLICSSDDIKIAKRRRRHKKIRRLALASAHGQPPAKRLRTDETVDEEEEDSGSESDDLESLFSSDSDEDTTSTESSNSEEEDDDSLSDFDGDGESNNHLDNHGDHVNGFDESQDIKLEENDGCFNARSDFDFENTDPGDVKPDVEPYSITNNEEATDLVSQDEPLDDVQIKTEPKSNS